MDEDEIVYSLTIEDIQHVACETIERELNDKDIISVKEKFGDFIDWYNAIQETINYLNIE